MSSIFIFEFVKLYLYFYRTVDQIGILAYTNINHRNDHLYQNGVYFLKESTTLI